MTGAATVQTSGDGDQAISLNPDDTAVTDLKSLRQCANATIDDIAWPTIWLSIGSLAGFLLFTSLAITGAMPLWAAALLNIPCYFIAYTGYHEAVHRNFHGRHQKFSWLNDVFGVIFGVMFFYPYVMHSYIHLTHHANTNDPEKDPDAWMHGDTALQVALRGFSLAYRYYGFTLAKRRKEPGSIAFFRRLALEGAPIPISVAALIITGNWHIALFVWFVPTVIGVALLGACFDWVVHHPHKDRTLMGGTRTFLARKGWRRVLLNWLHLFQNYHIIHHIAPRAPFYCNEKIFLKGERFLRDQGAVIVEL